MTKKIFLEFEDTPEIREVLSTLGVHCFCDVAGCETDGTRTVFY